MVDALVDEELLAAAEHQNELWARIEAGEKIPNVRSASLKPGFTFKPVPDYGTGYYSVNEATGEVCEWNGVWMLDGKVLLCRDCYLDGT